jgi:hypothetical protein
MIHVFIPLRVKQYVSDKRIAAKCGDKPMEDRTVAAEQDQFWADKYAEAYGKPANPTPA